MCTTCNTKSFDHVGTPPEDFLQKELYRGVFIQCKPDATRFSVCVEGDPNRAYRIYYCPSCGRFLWKGR